MTRRGSTGGTGEPPRRWPSAPPATSSSCTARAPPEIARERLATRTRTASDATTAVAAAMAIDADSWPEARIVVTTGGVDRSLDRATTLWDNPSWSS